MTQKFKYLSILLMVFVIGFNFTAEAAGCSFFEITDSHSNELTFNNNPTNLTDNSQKERGQPDSAHSDKKAPCNLGICHLGHCAQPPQLVLKYLSFFSKLVDTNLININLLGTDSPFLDGLRRPPRFS